MSQPTDLQPPSLARIFSRLMPYLRPRWAGLALAGVGTVGATIVDLAKPWPLKLVFDRLLGDGAAPFATLLGTRLEPAAFLALIAILIVGIALLDGLFSYWRVYSLTR